MLTIMFFLLATLPLEIMILLSMERVRNIFHLLRYDESAIFRPVLEPFGVESVNTGNFIESCMVLVVGCVGAISVMNFVLMAYLSLDFCRISIQRMR
jgi:hypothetical protein